MNVVFDVLGAHRPLHASLAAVLADRLREPDHGDERTERQARELAEEIEDALAGRRSDPIPLSGQRADVVFQRLRPAPNPADRRQLEELDLYRAVRTVHLALRADGGSAPAQPSR